jgi:hypothetical protein
MRNGTSQIMVALIASACFLAVGMLRCPEWLTGISQEERRTASLQLVATPSPHCVATKQRIAAKSQIIEQLFQDEISLIQAAQMFAYHNSYPIGFEDLSWQRLSGNDDGEKICRQVINWVSPELINRCTVSEREMRMVRYEQELSNHIARHGGVQLRFDDGFTQP